MRILSRALAGLVPVWIKTGVLDFAAAAYLHECHTSNNCNNRQPQTVKGALGSCGGRGGGTYHHVVTTYTWSTIGSSKRTCMCACQRVIPTIPVAASAR